MAQVHYASRLPGDMARQDYLGAFYYGFVANNRRNVILDHGLWGQPPAAVLRAKLDALPS
ncbi:MAG: hypothetical protein ABSH02_12690 [Candidatus Sulfotelmatobacter sp.]